MPDVVERIMDFNRDRDPQLLQLKYNAIRESSFRFLRGTCHLFYEDISRQNPLPASPPAWLCGDLHLENFGSFKGSDREVYFDINDFDEAILGPALFDLSRLLVSIGLACNAPGGKKTDPEKLLKTLVAAYCKTLEQGKPLTIETGAAKGLVKILLDKVAERKEKKLVKEKADKAAGYEKLVIDDKKSFRLETPIKKELIKTIQLWLDQTRGKGLRKIHDVASAVAGTGSIGIKRYLALASNTESGKKYLLVVKQALPSSLQSYLTLKQPAWANEAERVSQVEFRMQHATPGGLGVLSFRDDWYVAKWIQPEADKINLVDFLSLQKDQPLLMVSFGSLLASAQLRSSGRQGSATTDEMIRFATRPGWVDSLLNFARDYAGQLEKDFAEYCRAYDSGILGSSRFKK